MNTTVEAPDLATRPAVCYLNYRRDVTAAIAAMLADGQAAFGPSTMGEALWPVEAVYNPNTGVTTVGLSYMPPPTQPGGQS